MQNILITSYLEQEHVDQIRKVDPRVNVLYQPGLLPPPRYPADHTGGPLQRTPNQERQWQELLGTADILFDFDQTHREDLPELAPQVRWIQGTSSGIGQLVRRLGYDKRMPNTIFTTASGVHAGPLAEFCVMVMLMFNKGLLRMIRAQSRRHWERYAGTDLAGRTVGIIGVGAVGSEVARVCRTFRMKVVGVKRQVEHVDPSSLNLDTLFSYTEMNKVLKQAEYLVLVAPHTPETEKMIGAEELAMLPKGAILINIGRGALVEEPALIEALRSGHLGGAALDVFAEEPLPEESPLWDLPNVLVSPHSGSTSDRENARLTDLFCDNLQRFLSGKPLRNVLDTQKLY